MRTKCSPGKPFKLMFVPKPLLGSLEESTDERSHCRWRGKSKLFLIFYKSGTVVSSHKLNMWQNSRVLGKQLAV